MKPITAIGNVAGKLASVLYSCLKTKTSYDETKHKKQLAAHWWCHHAHHMRSGYRAVVALEPDEGNLSRPVLRGVPGSNAGCLPDLRASHLAHASSPGPNGPPLTAAAAASCSLVGTEKQVFLIELRNASSMPPYVPSSIPPYMPASDGTYFPIKSIT